jgi:hypothetical protein
VPSLVPIKRGRKGGDLRVSKTLVGFLWGNSFCIMCCVHFRSELFFGFICAEGGFLSAVFLVSQIDTFALQIFEP